MNRVIKAPVLVFFLACLLAAPSLVEGQTASDSTAIEQAALDYIQGFFTGDAERMERALHPDVTKRRIRPHPNNGRDFLEQMSAMTLVQMTRAGADRPRPPGEQRSDVTILDIFENVASVRIDAAPWIDYLHLARWNGEWKIVNVLWELRPRG